MKKLATVEQYADGVPTGNGFYVLVGGREYPRESKATAKIMAGEINAAHEAAVRKAVEEFRGRAANQCEKRAESISDGSSVARQCGRDILALPIEEKK